LTTDFFNTTVYAEAIPVTESIEIRLFRLLEQNTDNYISGAALARKLSVSRNAIWKAVESLREEGYDISAISNKGYRLNYCSDSATGSDGSTGSDGATGPDGSAGSDGATGPDGSVGSDSATGSDGFSQTGIAACIKTTGIFRVELRKTVTSTNTVLRELAAKGAPEGLVIVAEEQTAGKGRQGRSFHSPADCGVYLSVLLRPCFNASDATLITSAAAVAAAQAIEEVFGVYAGIKWVNDLFVDGKKVCGILTEATFGMESGIAESIVLGIGVNVTRPGNGFPGTLEDIAVALTENTGDIDNQRCRLIAATLDNFWTYYLNLAVREFLEEYRKRSIILGSDIFVVSGDEKTPATALGIDSECRLIVRYEDGNTAVLSSGEVSIRKVDS
jgi:BirA family biotin operon repressor/biotin-[acetyl-CoA-carboxylase] ligase